MAIGSACACGNLARNPQHRRAVYGGSGVGNYGSITADAIPAHGQPASAEITLPPLATLYFTPQEQ